MVAMNEILKKRIDDFASEYAERMYKNSTDGERKAAEHDVIKGAEFILCRQWISIDEALPEEDPDLDKWLLVLVRVPTEEGSTRDVLQLGLYYGNGRFSCESRNIKAVAWMPIPEMEG